MSQEITNTFFTLIDQLNLTPVQRQSVIAQLHGAYSNIGINYLEALADLEIPGTAIVTPANSSNPLTLTTQQVRFRITSATQVEFDILRAVNVNGVPNVVTYPFSTTQMQYDLAAAALAAPATAAAAPTGTLKKVISKIEENLRSILAAAAFLGVVGNAAAIMGRPRQEMPFGLKPEAVVGPVPLYSIQQLERAKSDRKMKTRALGDVFLAHQKGNRDVLRLDGTLQGPLRFYYLWLLITLQSSSEAQEKNLLDAGATLNPAAFVTPPKDIIKAKNNMLNYEIHRTFPIITQFAIMTNMYLQTIEWHRSVEEGQDVIKYHLLFRKYVQGNEYHLFDPLYDPSDPTKLIGAKAFSLSSGKVGTVGKWLEFSIDAIWKMMRMYGEIYGHMLIKSDGKESWEVDQEAVSSVDKLTTSYQGKLFGLFTENEFVGFTRYMRQGEAGRVGA